MRYGSGSVPLLTPSATRPNSAVLERTLRAQCARPVTFSGPLTPTAGFRFARVLRPLGSGPDVFAQAVRGLHDWAVYPAWITLHPHPAPLRKGSCAVFVTGFAPLWTVSAVRITDVETSARRFAFTLRTLPQHALTGAERFCVYRDERGAVWYELTALSRPQGPLARFGTPAVRLVQARFARDSARSLKQFVERDGPAFEASANTHG